jgi:hypothetical protein
MSLGRWCAATLVAAVLMTGCGQEDDLSAQQSEGLVWTDAGPACQASGADMLGSGSADTRCDGPWEHQRYVSPCYALRQDALCGIQGYQQTTCYPTCRDISFGIDPAVAPFTKTVPGTWYDDSVCKQVRVCERMCGEYVCAETDMAPGGLYCWYEEQCTAVRRCDLSAADAAWNSYGTYKSQVILTKNYTTCSATLSNVPTFKLGSSAVCGPGTQCDDTTKPIYKTCADPSFGDAPGRCGIVSTGGIPNLFYSAPGYTFAEIRVGTPTLAADKWVVPQGTAPSRCMTCDDLPTGTPAEVKAKHDCLANNLWNAGARAADPARFQGRIAGKVKHLFELKGNLLDDVDAAGNVTGTGRRGWAQWLYQSAPADRAACGKWLTPPPEPAPLTEVSGFEGTPALGGWELLGSVGTTAGRTGGAAALLAGAGTTGIARAFHVPSTGPAQFTFWYRNTCAGGAGEGVLWKVYDNTTRVNGLASRASPLCTPAGAWTPVTMDLSDLRGHVASVYLQNVDAAATAGTSTTLIDDVSFSWTPRMDEGALQMCDRLSQPHTPRPVAEYLAADCINALGWAAPIPATDSGRAAHVDALREVSLGELGWAFGEMNVPGVAAGAETSSQRVTQLRKRMALAQRWYERVRTGFYVGDAAAQANQLWTDSSSLIGAVSRGAGASAEKRLRDLVGNPLASPTAVELALSSYLADEFSADRELLRAALPTEPLVNPPLPGAPLLFLLADALQPMSDRLGHLDAYQDLACRFRSCRDTSTEPSQLHRLLGAMADPSGLQTALAGATKVRVSPAADDFKDVFQRLLGTHATALQAAVQDATGQPYLPGQLEATSASTPRPLLGLAGIVIENKKRSDLFLKSGLFLADGTDTLSLPLDAGRKPALAQVVSGQQGVLTSAISTFRNSRRTLADEILLQVDNQQVASGLEKEVQLRSMAVQNLSADLKTLRIVDSLEERRFANLALEYERQLADIPIVSDYAVQRNLAPIHLSVSALQSQYTGGTANSVPAIAVPAFKLVGAPGDLVTFRITGQWAPSCALSKTPNLMNIPVLAAPVTGPQGYYLTTTGTNFQVNSVQTGLEVAAHASLSVSHRDCMGLRAEASTGFSMFGSGVSLSAYAYSETCVAAEAGLTTRASLSSIGSTGGEVRNSASFALGLRLKSAPFPDFPVGSLLAVQMRPFQTGPAAILDVQVLQPESAVRLVDDAELYLVVNDRADCATRSASALDVSYTHTRMFGSLAKKFGLDLQKARNDLLTKLTPMMNQGRLLPGQLTELHSAADLALGKACQCAVESFPSPILAFWRNWVDAEVARAERQVELRAISRQLEAALVQLQAANDDLTATARKGRLLRSLPLLTLRSLDGREIRTAATAMIGTVESWLAPFVALRFSNTDTASVAELDQLKDLDWMAPVDKLAETANTAVSTLLLRLDAAMAGSSLGTDVVAVAFPKSDLYAPAWKTADSDRSGALWQAVADGTSITIRVKPEDLYQGLYGNANLLCTQSNPIIRSMAIFTIRPTSQTAVQLAAWNETDPYVGLKPNPNMAFALDQGEAGYRFLDPNWLVPRLPLLHANDGNVLTLFGSAPSISPAALRNVALGLSPFDSFELPAGTPLDPYGDALGLVVVFKVETRDLGQQTLSWVSTCGP